MSTEQQPNKPYTVTVHDGSTVDRIVNLAVKTKPAGWARKSYATYYKKRYAVWIQRDVDAMIVDRSPKIYRKDLWPNVSVQSLYLRVNQAVRFLTDVENEMDPDGKYRIWHREVHIGLYPKKGYPKIGVVMDFDPVTEGEEPRAESFIGEADMPNWKLKLDSWLEDSSQTEPFYKGHLLLTPEQIEQLKMELDGLQNILFTINSREIKVIKS